MILGRYNKESGALEITSDGAFSRGDWETISYHENATEARRRDFIGYGSGCGILPAFDGGVGISSHGQIFENIGFSFHQSADTRTVDAYTITRKTKKAMV